MTSTTTDPEWDLTDRMRKALREAGVEVKEMALYLGVARNTVSHWLNDRDAVPRPAYIRLWALRCGVSYEWLCDEVNVVRLKGKGKARP